MFSSERFTKPCTAWTKNITDPLKAILITLNEPKLALVTNDPGSKPYQEKLGREMGKLTFRRITI
jgi:hypothetical protein